MSLNSNNNSRHSLQGLKAEDFWDGVRKALQELGSSVVILPAREDAESTTTPTITAILRPFSKDKPQESEPEESKPGESKPS